MTWTVETSCGHEQDKIAPYIVPYTRGLVLDVGCGLKRAWPHFVGVDTGHHFGQGDAAVIIRDTDRLDCFASNQWDAVFSSHTLEHIDDTVAALLSWWRVIKVGGHLVLYLPHKQFYPNIGEPGANPDHKHDFMPQDIIDAMYQVAQKSGHGFKMLEHEERNGSNEYSFYQVYQKSRYGWSTYDLWQRHPDGKKRALVVRFGAIGDQIMAASILPQLKEQGFHVTYMTTPAGQEVLQHDPHIDAWWIQDKNQVPNPQLGPYLTELESRFDKVVNLSESIEGSLLTLGGRPNNTWNDEARRRILGSVNYLERTHDIAVVPHVYAPVFYPTGAETREAEAFKQTMSGPVIYWAIGGSSHHKIYPFANVVIGWLLDKTPCHIVLGTGPDMLNIEAAIYETVAEGGFDVGRLHKTGGIWSVRRALSFVEKADCVVGAETGMVNAVSHLSVPTVVMLSHSSRENLTKHWRNTIVIEPENTPCYPCHRLHFNWDYCHFVEETGGALCASNIKPERLFNAIIQALGDELDGDVIRYLGRIQGHARIDQELDQPRHHGPGDGAERGAGHHLSPFAALADEG
jgi:ADP-heptose:LPS heptosyltransferase/predicted SAM-dependent methyltransferase